MPKRAGRSRKRKPKLTVEKVHGFSIRQPTPGRFIVHVRRQGMTLHESFATLESARTRCEQLHNERVNEGLRAFEMSAKDREEAKAAKAALAGRATIAEAVKFWMDHHPNGMTVTLSGLAEAWLADLKRRNCRPSTIAGAGRRLKRLERDHGTRPACSITTRDLAAWLEIRGGGLVNRDNFRRCFRACFAYGLRQGIVLHNPVEGIEASKRDARLPDHWTTAQVANLLRAAEAFAPVMVPVLAVMAFAGLRPDEAAAIRWEHVNLSASVLRVLPAGSKTRRARVVDIMPNLSAWLAAHRRDNGTVAPPKQTFRRWRARVAAVAVLGIEAVRERLAKQKGKFGPVAKAERNTWRAIIEDATKAAGGKLWPVDVLRHTYATYWLAEHNDLAKLAVLMGNSQDVILRHYRGLATAAEAKDYWSIRPAEAGKVIRLNA